MKIKLPHDCHISMEISDDNYFIKIKVISKELKKGFSLSISPGWFLKMRCKKAVRKIIKHISKLKEIKNEFGI